MVISAIFVTALDATIGITQEILLPFLATEIIFIRLLHTQVAGIIALHIITIVAQLLHRHLPHIAQDIGPHIIDITAYRLVLDVKTGITIEFLLQHAILFDREAGEEQLGSKRGVAGIEPAVAHITPPLLILVKGNTQGTAQVKCIEWRHLAGYHHQVVGGLVVDHETPVAVIDKSARRILHLGKYRVVIGQLVVSVVKYLKREKTGNIKQNHREHKCPDDILSPFVGIVFSHRFLSINKSTTSMTSNVSNVLPTMRPARSDGEKNENDSAQKMTVQKTAVRITA